MVTELTHTTPASAHALHASLTHAIEPARPDKRPNQHPLPPRAPRRCENARNAMTDDFQDPPDLYVSLRPINGPKRRDFSRTACLSGSAMVF